MSVHRNPNGSVTVRWHEAGRGSRQRKRTFAPPSSPGQPTALQQARAFDDEINRRKRLGGVVDLDRGKVTFAELVEDYWRLHAIPNLAVRTRAVYGQTWAKHLHGRIGGREVRAFEAKHVNRLRLDLENAKVGAQTIRKAMSFVQSLLTFAVLEGHVDRNVAKDVRKPKDIRERTPYVFSPLEVEQIRAHLDQRDAALVSVLAYTGPRPEEALRLALADLRATVVRYDGRKTGGDDRFPKLFAPVAAELRELVLATGARGPRDPLFPAHDGGHWQDDDWRNWRRRVWQSWIGTTDPKCKHAAAKAAKVGACEKCGARRLTPVGSRPRDLRGSYVTLRAYEGVPLTTIAKEVGCSVAMLDRHYAGELADWDGVQRPFAEQINAARAAVRDGLKEAL